MTTIKNGADIKRAELEQCCRKLKVAETKCGSLKSKINYMKMYCQIKTDKTKVEPVMETITGNSQEHNLIPENSKTSRNISLYDSNVSVLTNQNYFNFLQENENSEETIQENNEMNMYNDKVSKVEETGKLYRVLDSISVCSTLKPTTHETKQEEKGKEKEEFLENMICDDRKQSIESIMQKNIFSFKEPNEELIINNPTEWTNQISPSASPDINLQKLRLNISSSIKSSQTSKCRSLIKGNKESVINAININKKKSICKGDQTVNNKIKKRRGKLRNINSKSTVATKEINLTARKDIRKYKQKDHKTNHQLSEQHVPSSKLQHNWSEIVELYHNAAMKSDSISAVSSKLEVKKMNKRLNNGQYNMHIKLPQTYNQSQDYQNHQTNQYRNDNKLPSTSEKIAMVKNQYAYKPTQNVNKIAIPNNESKLYQQQNTVFDLACYVPMANCNYEMPTLASKLKRTNRSYFNRFNFRNIPFVVGTSITPSHNLGLNIQQVLSIMKTRQQNATGITPLLIRKISRGLEPVSTLMNQMVFEMENDHHIVKTLENKCLYAGQSSSKFIKQSQSTIEPQVKPQIIIPNETNSFINPDNIQKQTLQVGRESIKNYHSPVKNTTTKFTSKCDFKNYPQTMHSVSKEKHNTEDCIKSNFKSNMQLSESKGIREILMNLHDQFEAMNVKYENLQIEAEKSNDQSLMSEIIILEKELNSKEEEINALISLYKEVMVLKQQMKILQQKNSLVCIATKVPTTNKIYSSTPVSSSKTSKDCTRDAMHTFSMKRQTITNTSREVSTSIKLVGLLRQIQMFQKQLKLTS